MYNIEDLKKIFPKVDDEKFINAISKGVLKLSDSQINTIIFVFFICYWVENDLNAVIADPWKEIYKMAPEEEIVKAKKSIERYCFGEDKSDFKLKEILKNIPKNIAKDITDTIDDNYSLKRNRSIDNLEYLTDKISFYQNMFGENNVSKVLWKFQKVRNDISHGRINVLKYDENEISLRSTKEKMLIDYLEAFSNPDHSKLDMILKVIALQDSKYDDRK